MENIKIVDMNDAKIEQDMQDVKGGAVFAKFDGIDGESTEKDHGKWIDLVSVSSPIYR